MAYIPGCVRSLTLYPAPKWPVALRNTRALHGMLTVLLGTPHRGGEPNFSLLPFPGGSGWAAQWLDASGMTLPSRVNVDVFNAPRVLEFGPPMRLKRPPAGGEGPSLVCLDTVTPVLVRHDGKTRATVDAGNLVSALSLSPRMERALESPVRKADVSLEIVARDTRGAHVQVGGKWGESGALTGWEGRLVLHCNAYTRYLLEVSALVGLGGRTALGFGRVHVREVRP